METRRRAENALRPLMGHVLEVNGHRYIPKRDPHHSHRFGVWLDDSRVATLSLHLCTETCGEGAGVIPGRWVFMVSLMNQRYSCQPTVQTAVEALDAVLAGRVTADTP